MMGGPSGRPSQVAQTPGEGPASNNLPAWRLTLVVIAVPVGPIIGAMVIPPPAVIGALLVPMMPPATIIGWGYERAVCLGHCGGGCRRGEGADCPDDRPSRNNS